MFEPVEPEEPVSEAPVPVVQERIVEKRGGFGAALLGGAVAAVIGFVAGKSGMLDTLLPPSMHEGAAVLEPIKSTQADLKSDVARLRSTVAEIAVPDLEPLQTRMDQLEASIEEVSIGQSAGEASPEMAQRLQALSDRVAALEARPLSEGASSEAVAAFEAELQRVRDSLSAQQADVTRMVAEAQAMEQASAEAARIAAAQTVVSRLRSALDAGVPYAGLLGELQAQNVEAPDALKAAADTGVATIATLRDSFAPAAREALAAAREDTKGTGGLMAYVNRHLGARSVTPRDGDDADAILSRAGAAVEAGDIATALTELEALPESAQPALATWQGGAQTRLDAEAALDALSQSLNAN